LVLGLAFGPIAANETGEPPSRLADLLGSDAEAAFARALEPREFSFPADHGPHPDFRNEWWYVTGNLDSDDGRRFGYELTIFRFALAPEPPASASQWRTNQVYIAHLAVTDADKDRFFVAQRYARGALGLAGAEAEPFKVWADDWSIAEERPGSWRLAADDGEFAIDVSLSAQKAPVLNGVDGLSQKSSEPGNASYYYSITRLGTEGRVRIDGREFGVSGLSWLDREWSTSALADDQVGWDWFALQFSDGSDLWPAQQGRQPRPAQWRHVYRRRRRCGPSPSRRPRDHGTRYLEQSRGGHLPVAMAFALAAVGARRDGDAGDVRPGTVHDRALLGRRRGYRGQPQRPAAVRARLRRADRLRRVAQPRPGRVRGNAAAAVADLSPARR
jgi:hypothetical protein